MKKIIPHNTFKFIEAKLHGYEEIKQQIEEWELSVKYPENRQVVPGAGYISDPTANMAVKFAEPPGRIIKLIKWLELIEETREFCEEQKNKLFDIWYGKSRKSCLNAYTTNGLRKKTFEKNRHNTVCFLLIRAMNAGLYSLNKIDEDA